MRTLERSGRHRVQITCNISGAHRVQITCNISGAHRVQITCNISGAHRVQIPCNISGAHSAKGQFCYKFSQSLNRIYFSFILLAETINRRRSGGHWGTRTKPLTTSFRKCHLLKSPKFKSQNETRTLTPSLVAG